MTQWRVKSLKGYDEPFVLNAKRKPTSVALEERTIRRLKVVAKKHGIPYQVLMRIFITYGLGAMKKVS